MCRELGFRLLVVTISRWCILVAINPGTGKRVAKTKRNRPVVGASSSISAILFFVSWAVAGTLLKGAVGLLLLLNTLNGGVGYSQTYTRAESSVTNHGLAQPALTQEPETYSVRTELVNLEKLLSCSRSWTLKLYIWNNFSPVSTVRKEFLSKHVIKSFRRTDLL